MEMSSVGDIACSKGMASVAGATAGGLVTGALTGAANGKGNPYAVGATAISGAFLAGAAQTIANVSGPYMGSDASGTIASIMNTYLSDPRPNSVAINGLSFYFISKVTGSNPGRGAELSRRAVMYVGAATVTNRGLGAGALVAGPVFGTAGAMTDFAIESGWNNFCGIT